MNDQDALDRLDNLWRCAGDLSQRIIANAKGVPSPTTYISRFGSLASAYKLIGFELHLRLQITQSKEKVRALMGRGGLQKTRDPSAERSVLRYYRYALSHPAISPCPREISKCDYLSGCYILITNLTTVSLYG